MTAGNELPRFGEGWSKRAGIEDKSIAWHFFRNGQSICPNKWKDPAGPLIIRISAGGIVCTRCMTERLNELQS